MRVCLPEAAGLRLLPRPPTVIVCAAVVGVAGVMRDVSIDVVLARFVAYFFDQVVEGFVVGDFGGKKFPSLLMCDRWGGGGCKQYNVNERGLRRLVRFALVPFAYNVIYGVPQGIELDTLRRGCVGRLGEIDVAGGGRVSARNNFY